MTIRSEHRAADNIEPTFVPGRNDIFISVAAARLYSRGRALGIVGGWNAADAAGYPDCTPGFLTAKAFTLEKALDCEIDIVAPVIADMKHDIIRRAVQMRIPLQHTWSCYTPILTDNGWAPCHKCVSCKIRDKGFKKANKPDPLEFIELREV
jgi:7-cyano-7-deazaguanine synthase